MISYALLQGARELELWGINQSSSSEYFYEKNGVETWLGYALGMGVKVTINGEKSEVFSNKRRLGGNILYGYNCTYDQFVRDKGKYGEGIIKKLSAPASSYSRTIQRKFGTQ